jgi:hypothetical protein
MNDIQQTYLDILKIISEVRSEPIHTLSLTTSINIDLGVYGDDWDDLILPITKKYPISDFSAFTFLNHMSSEGDTIIPFMTDLIICISKWILAVVMYPFNSKKSKEIFQYKPFKGIRSKNNPLYIADILNSAIKGKWEYAKDSELDLHDLIR